MVLITTLYACLNYRLASSPASGLTPEAIEAKLRLTLSHDQADIFPYSWKYDHVKGRSCMLALSAKLAWPFAATPTLPTPTPIPTPSVLDFDSPLPTPTSNPQHPHHLNPNQTAPPRPWLHSCVARGTRPPSRKPSRSRP